MQNSPRLISLFTIASLLLLAAQRAEAVCTPAHAITVTVNVLGDDCGGSGCDCGTPGAVNPSSTNCTLRAAVILANASSTCNATNSIEIPAAASDYVVSIPGAGETASATGDLNITRSVNITGLGATPGDTVISGDALLDDRLFQIAAGTTVTMQNLTLQNGAAAAASPDGGAISTSGKLTVTNVIFSGNSAASDLGGAISADTDPAGLSIIGCTFLGNSAKYGGGALSILDVPLSVSVSVFNGNTANGGSAISEVGSTTGFVVSDSTFIANISSVSGGGGAIYADLSGTANALVTRCLFQGNTANGAGAAIYVDNQNAAGTLTVENVTTTGNTGSSVIFAGATGQDTTIDISNTTMSGDTASTAAVVASVSSANAVVQLNADLLQDSVNCKSFGASIVDDGYNIESGTACAFGVGGTSKSSTSVTLGDLRDNGGAIAGLDTFAIAVGSPAMDAIPHGSCAVIIDQRDVERADGVAFADSSGNCDIGAYELTQPDLSVADPIGVSAASANVGDAITYTVVVTNNGPSLATSVVLTNTLPAGAVAQTETDGCTVANQVITCDAGNMPSGATFTLTATALLMTAGANVNAATVTTADNDIIPANNTASVSVAVTAPSASSSGGSSGGGAASSGGVAGGSGLSGGGGSATGSTTSGAITAAGPKPTAGCHCRGSGTDSSWIFALVFVAWLRRRTSSRSGVRGQPL